VTAGRLSPLQDTSSSSIQNTPNKNDISHLRRQLQATTPYFDKGYHRKTPTGQSIPYLSIKCGENHVGPLTEILSAYLDGTNTVVFLGRLLLSKMSTAEVDALFQTHADYMTNTRTISTAPTRNTAMPTIRNKIPGNGQPRSKTPQGIASDATRTISVTLAAHNY
jgi:hypothetical protein